jgi:chromosome segregation ATPase
VVEKVVADIEEIEKLGHKRTIMGAVSIPSKFWDMILNLVKEAFKSRTEIKELRAEIRNLKGEVKSANEAFEQQKSAYTRLSERVKPYLEAVNMFPEYMKETLDSLIASGRKQQEEYRKARQTSQQEQTAQPKRKRSTGLDL